MKLTEAVVEAAGPTCECGRGRLPIHCRKCGSRTIYVKDANSASFDLEEIHGITAQGFRCRRCGADFNEATPCEAPIHVVYAKTLPGNVSEAEVGGLQVDPPFRTPAAEAEHQHQLDHIVDLMIGTPERREALRRVFTDADAHSKTSSKTA